LKRKKQNKSQKLGRHMLEVSQDDIGTYAIIVFVFKFKNKNKNKNKIQKLGRRIHHEGVFEVSTSKKMDKVFFFLLL
jgi:hypothetical protein